MHSVFFLLQDLCDTDTVVLFLHWLQPQQELCFLLVIMLHNALMWDKTGQLLHQAMIMYEEMQGQ
jgi:hypothetical protein